MAKRRFNAKKIAQTPSLKRKMAELLAENVTPTPELSLTRLLTYGHRGFISYSEEELGKMFDKLYSEELTRITELKAKHLKELPKARAWDISRIERDIESLNKHLARFEEIADLIFEEKFL